LSELLTVLECLRHLANVRTSEFAVKKYRDRDSNENILFEVLLNKDQKLVVRIAESDFEKLIAQEEIILVKLGLFDSDMVIGNIRIRDILHDAEPAVPELSSFFGKRKNSKYWNKPKIYPLGIAGGKIKILSRGDQGLRCELIDLSNKMRGVYRLRTKDNNLFIKKEESQGSSFLCCPNCYPQAKT